MTEDYRRSEELYMADAMKLIESALRNLKYARSTQQPTTLRLLRLTICRGALRVARDVLDILVMQQLSGDCSLSPGAESSAPADSYPSAGAPRTSEPIVSTECEKGKQATAPTATQYSHAAPGKEPTAGLKSPCSKEQGASSPSKSGGDTNPVNPSPRT